MELGNALLFGKDKKNSVEAKTTLEDFQNGNYAVFIEGNSSFPLDAMDGVYYGFPQFKNVESIMALKRSGEYWCRPDFLKKVGDVPDETQILLIKHTDNKYTVILPVVSEFYRCVLKGDEDTNTLYARLFTQCDDIFECRTLAFMYAETNEPFSATKELFKLAIKELDIPIKLCEERNYPDMLEYLGWCSWDAMQIRVNEEGLIQKCKEFKENNIPVRWAIIDDMWADIPKFLTGTYSNFDEMIRLMHSSRLASFEAAPERFPKGLKHTIDQMKKYISWVGMWYPITGYWAGFLPDTKIAEELGEHLGISDSGILISKPEYEHFKAYFDYLNGFLKKCGADFVKVDNQSGARRHYNGMYPISKVAENMHFALEEATEKYFSNRLINCMGCSSENVWKRPSSPISRCSGDFMPENAEWFTKHILQCSFMSFMQGHLIWCDWDMWWTDDGQAAKNSLLRAISGGPVYVSDKIGRSRKEMIMPLCLNDGRILRCNRPAMPTLDCLTEDPEKSGNIFKLQNMCDKSGVIAAFNLDKENKKVKGTISPSDIKGLEGEKFAVYEYFSHKFYTMDKAEIMNVEFLNRDDFRLYVFVPIVDDFAAIGRTDKYISPLTVKRATKEKVDLYEKGPYAFYKNGVFYEE